MRISRYLPLLLILVAGSGCSALIYEIVWYQMLQLAIGATSASLGILLAIFMGGLCIGSIGLSRLTFAGHPLRIYAALELSIGVCGILVLFGIPAVGRLYVTGAEHGLPGMLLRAITSAVCLLPPTILMGASLPAIVRWIESTPWGVSWWGLLYGANTIGAVSGCLLAGFFLLRWFNAATATYFAAGINFVVSAVSFGLAAANPVQCTGQAPAPARSRHAGQWTIYITIALSGACALGAEVIWTRLMAMTMLGTVYVFSIILAVFLAGLAIGSAAGSLLSRVAPARLALGWCQMLIATGIAWTAYVIGEVLPYLPTLLETGPWRTLEADLARCVLAILPATILWGASFPLALAAVARPGEDPGRLVGGVYAANTFGAILGALGVSLVLVPWIGSQQSQRVLLTLSALSAMLMLAPLLRESRSKILAARLAASMVMLAVLGWNIPSVPPALIAYGRQLPVLGRNSTIAYATEGRNSSVAIAIRSGGVVEIGVNGHVEASTQPYDMRLQRIVAHLPALLHPHPQSVLGIGFGAGVSAGAFTRYGSIRRITVCEIEPVIPAAATRYFARQDYDVMHDSRTRIVYDDARHYVLTSRETFDIVASDPLDVFVKGTAGLYSKEYFEAVKRHLSPGGMFTLYVPLYESDLRTVQSELATFFEVFPDGTIWGNTINGEGYDTVFMGQAGPLRINLDDVQERLKRPDYAPVVESLGGIGISAAIELFSTYAGQRPDLAVWLRRAEITNDRDLRLQYLAGWGVNSHAADDIYRQILNHRSFPENLFTGSRHQMQTLRSVMSGKTGNDAIR